MGVYTEIYCVMIFSFYPSLAFTFLRLQRNKPIIFYSLKKRRIEQGILGSIYIYIIYIYSKNCVLFLSQLLFGKNFKPTEKLQKEYNAQSYVLHLDSSVILPHNALFLSIYTHTHTHTRVSVYNYSLFPDPFDSVKHHNHSLMFQPCFS